MKNKKTLIILALSLMLSLSVVVAAPPSVTSPELVPSKPEGYGIDDEVFLTVSTIAKDYDTVYLGVIVLKEGVKQYTGNDIESWADSPCIKPKKCERKIKLKNSAGSYQGFKIYPIAVGVVGGRQDKEVINTKGYQIPLTLTAAQGISGTILTPNTKPTLSLTTNKQILFRGDSVKINVKGTDGDNNMKLLRVNVRSLNIEPKVYICTAKEGSGCIKEFEFTMPYSGTISIEAEAEDHRGEIDKKSMTIEVTPKAIIVKGLNVFKASDIRDEMIIDIGNFISCYKPEVVVFDGDEVKRITDYTYKVSRNDDLVIIYCGTKETKEIVDECWIYPELC